MSWSFLLVMDKVCAYVPSLNYVRQEALRRWQKKLGLGATYRKLLEVFVQAGHTECAEALCQVLKIKCKYAHF